MSIEFPKSALILVGGYGTRLRPLTLTVPKPLVPFCNKPMLCRLIDHLYLSGVNNIVLATSSRDNILEAITLMCPYKDLKIQFSYEDKVLGTAGPIKLASSLLTFPCYVLNSDIICNFPFKEMYMTHFNSKCLATILTTKVNEPSKYGVIVTEKDSNIVQRFVEKPKEFVGDRINAGVYVIEKRILDFIKEGECSIEKLVFPKIAEIKELRIHELEGLWMDIGQPKDYLKGVELYFNDKNIIERDRLNNDNYIFINDEFEPLKNYKDIHKNRIKFDVEEKIPLLNSQESKYKEVKEINTKENIEKLEEKNNRVEISKKSKEGPIDIISKKIKHDKQSKSNEQDDFYIKTGVFNLESTINSNDNYIQNNNRNLQNESIKKETMMFDTKESEIINTFPYKETKISKSIIHKSSKIGIGCEIGPNVVIGKDVKIGNYVKIKNSTILESCVIENGCYINNSIVGWKTKVKKWGRIEYDSVLGSEVIVGEGIYLSGTIVLPFKNINENSRDKVLM